MIYFQVEMEDLTRLEADLEMTKDKSTMVLRSAINSVAKQTKELLIDEAYKEYYITKANLRKTMDIEKATTRHMEAIVRSVGGVNELYDFRVKPRAYRPNNRPLAGHTGNVRKSRSPKSLYLKPGAAGDKYKAFVVKYKSGHITVAQRVPGTHMKEQPWKEGIKSLLSSSVPNMLGYDEGVFGVVEPQIYDMMAKSIQEQIQKYMKYVKNV